MFLTLKGPNMGDYLQARIGTLESIQEELGHDVQEMKEQLARIMEASIGLIGKQYAKEASSFAMC